MFIQIPNVFKNNKQILFVTRSTMILKIEVSSLQWIQIQKILPFRRVTLIFKNQ